MRRRAFIALLGGAAAWPLAVRAQQGERVRRIGVLVNVAPDHPEGKSHLATFQQALQELGWADGRNIRLQTRGAAGVADNYRKHAAELIAAAPDVVLAVTTLAVEELQKASRTVPIIFTQVIDPVGSGLVASMARPGGNATGFTSFEYAISSKWLDLLKEIAPRVTRVAVLRTASAAAGIGQFSAIQTVAPIGMELSAIGTRDAAEVERGIAEFASGPNGGLIVTASGFGANHPHLIAMLAARHNLPAVFPFRYYVASGGLICYGPIESEQYRLAASYVDRILKGERPAALPVQAPSKFELVINLKTAKALGLDIPPTVLARADEVIE
ncbi:MAG: ABC transporter substrate-binding protein [Xanthobacteraceae bacterium]